MSKREGFGDEAVTMMLRVYLECLDGRKKKCREWNIRARMETVVERIWAIVVQ